MNFLKKHYEKVVLFALFVIFAILLVHLYFIVQSTREVKAEHLEIPTRDPDYKIADVKSDDFNIGKLFKKNVALDKIGSRDGKGNKDFSDLLEIFKISRCGKCQYLIPRRVMESQETCFNCHEKLHVPKKEEVGTQVAARLDHDDDGIPDVVELLFGLDPYNADDALGDLDEDGFVNVYEYLALQHTDEFKKIFSDERQNVSADEIKNMSLKNPKVHPELANGMFIEKIERQKLNARLLGVSVLKGHVKENWNIQMEVLPYDVKLVPKKRRRRLRKAGSVYLYIGDTLSLVSGDYTIHDIRKDEMSEKNAAKKKVEKNKDNKLDTSYCVILKDSKKRDVIMRVGVDTYDLEHEVYLRDVWGYGKYSGKVGSYVYIGNVNIGRARYRIKDINRVKESVTLDVLRKGEKDIVVKRKALMPKEFIPRKEKKEGKDDAADKNSQPAVR